MYWKELAVFLHIFDNFLCVLQWVAFNALIVKRKRSQKNTFHFTVKRNICKLKTVKLRLNNCKQMKANLFLFFCTFLIKHFTGVCSNSLWHRSLSRASRKTIYFCMKWNWIPIRLSQYIFSQFQFETSCWCWKGSLHGSPSSSFHLNYLCCDAGFHSAVYPKRALKFYNRWWIESLKALWNLVTS